MLANLLVAAGVTIPMWVWQKATKKPVEPAKTHRARAFVAVLGTLAAADIALLGIASTQVKDGDAAGALGRRAALPGIVLLSGLARGKEGWMRKPFARIKPATEA